MNQKILRKLYEPFELKERRGVGNQTFKYVASDDIVDRMNQVFQGNWSTEVLEAKEFEGHLLVRVRVYVKDPTAVDSFVFYHEGYASQQIARFTEGPKSGQVIDIGNTYKSAMSKAVKVACAKWGVALRLDSDSSTNDSVPQFMDVPTLPSVGTKAEPVSPSVKPIVEPVIKNTPTESPSPNIPSGAPFDIPVGTPSVTAVPQGTPPKVPDQPVFNNESVVATGSPADTGIPSIGPLPSGGAEYLTDVQKVAIETIMDVHKIGFETLATNALKGQNVPVSLNEVTYQDAVKLIQYGNTLQA